MEPFQLKAGKDFHRRVQADWEETAKGGRIVAEHTIRLLPAAEDAKHIRRGRLDIFVDQLGDFVTVVEIKATDWDRVIQRNRARLLGAHRRQIWRYIEKFLDDDNVSVVPGIIYPSTPSTPGLREEIEAYLGSYGLQVVWFDD
jgi:hypothetical protein